MLKEFYNWHLIKYEVHERKEPLFFKEREVWWCHLGLNVGFEQNGKDKDFGRPILIVKKFNLNTFWALPITSKLKESLHCHTFESFDNVKTGSVILSQLRLLDAKRLVRKMGVFPGLPFEQVKNKTKNFL